MLTCTGNASSIGKVEVLKGATDASHRGEASDVDCPVSCPIHHSCTDETAEIKCPPTPKLAGVLLKTTTEAAAVMTQP